MTSRERARRILNHHQADRPAIDLGATRMTGTSAWTYGALKRALGIEGGHTRVYDLFQMLAEVEEPVLDALGCDFAMVPDPQLPYGLSRDGWKEFTFWDGQTFEVPAGFRPQRLPNGDLLIGDGPEWTEPVARMPSGGRYFDAINVANLTDTFEVPHLDESQWGIPGPLSDEGVAQYRSRIRALRASTERALVVTPPFNLTSGYGGLYQWGMKMALEPAHCREYVMAHARAMAGRARQFLAAVGEEIDVVVLSGADYGTQDREAFRPQLFGECMVPGWKVVCDAVHEFPGVKVWIHTCGSVPGLIPYIVEAGVDCLNPVQWGAAGMDRRWLKERFGRRLTFWGGAINTQNTFAFGTAAEVRREARECLEIFAPGGGYVVNPIHNIQADVPVENVLALYETARQYRY
ncbi:MAG: uroporphyrinogen decarboxylase family protein [Candidatus Latescibacterota bacterium]|jgi:uroporphyrinogen decarboxylase